MIDDDGVHGQIRKVKTTQHNNNEKRKNSGEKVKSESPSGEFKYNHANVKKLNERETRNWR